MTTPVMETVRRRYSLVVSSDRTHRLAAQRLRYDVFAAEPGFRLPPNAHGLDEDRFDRYCDHLLVRDEATERFVGCYRMLPPDAAVAAGSYYTESEFDLSAFAALRPHLVEMGRACVLPDHRNGSVVPLMWAGVLRYLRLTGHTWLMGCVSTPMRANQANPVGSEVQGVRDLVLRRYASAPEHRVRPYRPVVVDGRSLDDLPAPVGWRLPPLLNAYLRMGASICGEPAHDPDFGVADFVALVGLHEVNERYLSRLQAAAAKLDEPVSR
ncbi:GNAT family N-acetyltransferase [Aldersonia sp. NBC_00410]|uniref:GNAT family N-acetyltransferase n=1 Tax=Aldersonia sp. NBC_00410 TaxID=2975954 RepID=UPI0022568765|nr:GNAT family N-acyltransferase [Aldersonia sp. NBC_00410]MCX5046094.1 GNAT family N-acetyltransferase [Aldersonia sp. NBC_00410]